MLFLVMCKSLLCAFYFEIELYAMLFLVMCTSFCVLNYFSSRSLQTTRLYFSLRFDMSMYRCVSFVRYFLRLYLFTPLLYTWRCLDKRATLCRRGAAR